MTTKRFSLMDDASLIAQARKLAGPCGPRNLPGRNAQAFGQVRRVLESRGYTVTFAGREYQSLNIT
jgi:hypothetical protein